MKTGSKQAAFQSQNHPLVLLDRRIIPVTNIKRLTYFFLPTVLLHPLQQWLLPLPPLPEPMLRLKNR